MERKENENSLCVKCFRWVVCKKNLCPKCILLGATISDILDQQNLERENPVFAKVRQPLKKQTCSCGSEFWITAEDAQSRCVPCKTKRKKRTNRWGKCALCPIAVELFSTTKYCRSCSKKVHVAQIDKANKERSDPAYLKGFTCRQCELFFPLARRNQEFCKSCSDVRMQTSKSLSQKRIREAKKNARSRKPNRR